MWKSMKSAPKDGTPILVYVPKGNHNGYWWGDNPNEDGSIMAVASWSAGRWCFFYVHTHDKIEPTKWDYLQKLPRKRNGS